MLTLERRKETTGSEYKYRLRLSRFTRRQGCGECATHRHLVYSQGDSKGVCRLPLPGLGLGLAGRLAQNFGPYA